MINNPAINKQRGVSLLEVMIALVVLAIGSVSLVKFHSDLIRHSTTAQQQAVASLLAQKKIETFRHYELIEKKKGANTYEDIASGDSKTKTSNTTYTLKWEVNEKQDPRYKSVDITVSWLDMTGKNQSVNLSSIIGAIDPAQSGHIQASPNSKEGPIP